MHCRLWWWGRRTEPYGCVWTTGHSDVVPDQYTVPRIEDALTSLNGIKWFSVLDLRSGNYQILMSEADKEKTAFICPAGIVSVWEDAAGCVRSTSNFSTCYGTDRWGHEPAWSSRVLRRPDRVRKDTGITRREASQIVGFLERRRTEVVFGQLSILPNVSQLCGTHSIPGWSGYRSIDDRSSNHMAETRHSALFSWILWVL